MDKKQLRTFIRHKRKALSHHQQQVASEQLFQQFLNTSLHQSFQHFALYVAHQGEMNLKPLSDFLFQQHKSCYLPVLPDHSERIMHFIKFQSDEILTPNQYGILEPQTRHQPIAPEELDVVFVPLIAVDQKGFRLGAGGGYFDATFAFKKREPKLPKPLLIGIAYHWQQLDEIPVDDWDIKLDGLLTENNFLKFDN